MKIKLFTLLALLVFFSACSQPVAQETPQVLEKSHKFQTQDLKKIMFSLNISVSNNYANELEKEDTKVLYAKKLATDVKTIVLKLEAMAKGSLEEEMTPRDLEVYNENVEALYQNAHQIEEAASRYEVEKIDYYINQLHQNCTTCHDYFGVKHVL
jgi:cytochrome c556